MMAKVLHLPLSPRRLPCQPLPANPSSHVLFQSCAEGEEEVEEEGKEKTFEVKLQPCCCRSLCLLALLSSAFLSLSACRKRKWRSRRCCISKPGFTTEVLQRWFSRWSAPAKVGLAQVSALYSILMRRTVMGELQSFRTTGRHGDRHPSARHLHPERRQHPGAAGKQAPALYRIGLEARQSGDAHLNVHLVLALGAENAGLPEGEKRRGLLQESVWTDDVLQVVEHESLQQKRTWIFFFLSCSLMKPNTEINVIII